MTTPLWVGQLVVTREGDDIVTRCCAVAGGDVHPVEVRVNVPKLVASLRAMGLGSSGQGGAGGDSVSGFGSFLKKAVKAVTHNKVTRAVGKIAKKVASSPLAIVANPTLAISAHTLSKAATGKGTIKGPLGKVVDLGASAALSAAGPAAKLPSIGAGALKFVSPQASAALGVGLSSVMKAQAGGAISAAARAVQGSLPGLPPAAQSALKARVAAAGPALAKKAAESAKVKASFANIAQKAKAGSPEALVAARVIGRSAAAVANVERLQQAFSGGVPGLLITSTGKIVKAPKGKFIQKSSAVTRPDVLYRGRGAATLKGSFTAVSGYPAQSHAWGPRVGHVYAGIGASPSWGGSVDPGQDIEGPLPPTLVHPDGKVLLDDWTQFQVSGLTP